MRPLRPARVSPCAADHARFVGDEIAAVVAHVVGQRAQGQVGDPRHDRVEEEPIVRDEDDRVRVLVQVLLEPGCSNW